MRLLYLSPTASMGGAERVLLDLLSSIRRAQPSWVVGLIVANDGPLADDARRLGVSATVLPFPRTFARIGDTGLAGTASWAAFAGRAVLGSVSMARYIRRIRQEISAFEPDVVHSNGFKMHLLGALAKPAGASLVWHFHDYLGSRHVTCRLIQRLKHRCSAIVAVSENVADDIRRQLGDAVEISVVWNAVDLRRFKPEGPRLDLDALAALPAAEEGVVRVGLVATFARWKGHLLFLEMVRSLVPAHKIRGYIVGGPVYETAGSQCSREELRAAIARLGLAGTVGLTGFVRDSATALRGLDVVVHTSTSPEPFGLVIAEAMATGRAVVVSEAGGVAELVDGERNALTYAPGDVHELARQVERLIVDPAMRRRLGRAARQSAVEQFGPERFTEQMLGLYARFDRPSRRSFKIAVFSYGLPCPGAKRSGIEQIAHDLANALVDRGHAVTVFTYDPRPSNAGYSTGPLPCRHFVMSRFGRPLAMGYLGNLLALGPRYRDFDVIVAHGDSLLLPLTGKPVVRIMHGSALEEALSATSVPRAALQAGVYIQELITALLQRGTVAVSANARRFNPLIRRVIPNGIDLNVFRPEPTARSPRPSVLFVGALNGRKRGSWLLDQFERVIAPACPGVELHMVTKRGRPVPGVTYHTGITTSALIHLYQRAWVYASPSTYEGFGLPYVEALACGTPVVATPNPGSLEVLGSGRFGRLVRDDDFAAEICRLLADSRERDRYVRAGLLQASHYDIARSAAMYEALIEELVA